MLQEAEKFLKNDKRNLEKLPLGRVLRAEVAGWGCNFSPPILGKLTVALHKHLHWETKGAFLSHKGRHLMVVLLYK